MSSNATLASTIEKNADAIARNACGTLEFDRAEEMIELGRQVARDQLFRNSR